MIALAALAMLILVTRFDGPAQWFGFVPPPTGTWVLALLLPLAIAGLLKILQREQTPTRAAGRDP